jgi:dihydroneopterin aldolase
MERRMAMTYQEMVAEIPRLSVQERLALLEAVTRSLREELLPRTGSSLGRILGIAKPDGPLPTDEKIKAAYSDYLIEK